MPAQSSDKTAPRRSSTFTFWTALSGRASAPTFRPPTLPDPFRFKWGESDMFLWGSDKFGWR